VTKNPDRFESTFETYTVTRIMGEGGAGRVFEVRDSVGKALAAKCLRPELVTTERKKRFKNEIDFCKKHPHRNIVQVMDYGLVQRDGVSVPFYVMPLFAGTLRDLLEKKIQRERVLPLFSQVFDGVEAAHLLGVTHRDLKPENVLYDSTSNSLVIADFGIAHFEEDMLATPVETQVGAKMANLGYSAPEQRVRGGQVDRRADIYALGLMLNEAFTGHVPQGAGYATVAAAAAEYAYIDDLIAKMIQQQAGARPQSIEEVKKELIARQNQFVALQQVSAKTKEVVPASAPGTVAPVNLVGGDWDGGFLTFKLNRAPEQQWVQHFHNLSNISYVGGTHPSMFRFAGSNARIEVDERIAQRVIDQFKTWLPMATREYQLQLELDAEKADKARRETLRLELEAAQQRERVVRNLKF